MGSSMLKKIAEVKKSDAKAIVDLNYDGLHIEIASKVGALFEPHIKSAVQTVLKEENVQKAKITIIDNGALDFAIRARTKTAIQRAKKGMENE